MNTVEITTPSPPQSSLTNYDILHGTPIDPLQKLSIVSADEFEDIVLEWIHGYLTGHYVKIRRCGGAGDKGRDVIADVDPDNSIWDNYQCKHYDDPLMPTQFYIELGKLCYYTFLSDFSVPRKYYIVAKLGVGTSLGDMINNPEELRAKLVANWDRYVKDKITKAASVPLSGDLERYVNEFDFSIVSAIEPIKFLEQFRQTQWYAYRFGGLQKQRPTFEIPKFSDGEMSLKYISQLLAVYSEEISSAINSIDELSQYGRYKVHFDIQRKSFYAVETLKQFERDNLPQGCNAFERLKENVLTVVYTKIFDTYRNSFEKMNKILESCSYIDTSSNPLNISIEVIDKQGICHHLVNEDKMGWI